MSLNSFGNTSSEDPSDYSVVNKLRRLKIQESLFVNSINKISQEVIDSKGTALPLFYSVEYKRFAVKLKEDVTEIRNMFGDIKAQTEEICNRDEIENMKKEAMKLDDKIRTFKKYLQSEIASITSKEEVLNKQVNDVEETQTIRIIKSKARIKQFNHIVPSPVKVLIKSPFICKEAQQLQEFLTNSPNRYGGWNEYNHNIFVKIWSKYFTDVVDGIAINEQHITPANTEAFQAFEKIALQKIAGSTREDVLSHYKWYSKYLYLKEQQRIALNKWKKSKRMIAKTPNKQQTNQKKPDKKEMWPKKTLEQVGKLVDVEDILYQVGGNDDFETLSSSSDTSLQDADFFPTDIEGSNEATNNSPEVANVDGQKPSVSTVLKPTKQWTNRCNSLRVPVGGNYDLENIKKLRVPYWRLALQDKYNSEDI